MARKNLRVVADGETVAGRPVKLSAAAAAGDSRAMLVAMRARIAKAVESSETPPRDLASLTKRLVEVQREIEAIDAREQEVASVARRGRDDSFDASAI